MPVSEIHFEPAVNYDDALWRAAAEAAVETSYWDIFGNQHHSTREALQGILRSLGRNVDSFESIEAERRRRFAQNIESVLPATCVVSENDKSVPFSVFSGQPVSFRYRIDLEHGGVLTGNVATSQLAEMRITALDDRRWSTYRLSLPAEVPLGYHAISITIGASSSGPYHLIVCPDRCYLPESLADGGRTAGFNVALYGLRSERNWGCGDFSDLRMLTTWARQDVGFSFIGLNPLHALHNRAPYNTSPYLPLSMYYKNFIYVDIESVPEFQTSSCARRLAASSPVQNKIRRLRDAEFVEYSEVARLKRRFLKLLHRQFRRERGREANARASAFAAFCEREGDLLSRFALYCALDEVLHKQNRNVWTWRDWPTAYQTPDSPESRAFAQTHAFSVEFYKYIQFVIQEQLVEAQRHALDSGMSIGLYHDLAVATDNCGSDLWSTRDYYVTGCRVGAPPDDFSPQGQDWGFPPPNKEVHRAEGYRLYRESIRKIVRHGGALRIDHVMRLYRLFWVPSGMQPAQGAYVRDYAEDLLRVLALESVRSRNIIVGEDLGTVTDEMRDLFTRFGILSYRLFPFEKNYRTGQFKHSFEYPRQALVSSSTHDLPTLAGFWQNSDIETRRASGLADDASYRNQLHDRQREKQAILDLLHSEHLLPAHYTRNASSLNWLDGDLHNAVIGFLGRVPSSILLLNQEDFSKETAQQNLPGSTSEYPNWQRKMRVPVNELSGANAAPYSAMFRHHLTSNGR
jgi:4-alpha-glucanotransferase